MKRSKAVAPHRAAAASLVLVMSAAAVMSVGAGGCKKKQEGEKQMQEKPASEPFPLELRAVTLPSKSADSVDVRVLFQSGSVDDPKGKEGLTYVTAKMLAEGGTKQHAYAEVLQLLYPMAATIDVDVSRQMTVFVGRAHKDHLDSYFPLLFEVILEPRFAQEDFNRIKDETLNYIRKTLRQSDDELLSREALDVWIYEDHPYGHVVEGTVAGIESITLEGLEVKVVEKITDSTAIAMGVPVDIKRGHPDFFPLMLAFSCLGEHRQSMGRLFKTLREVRGLNYGDYAYIEHFIQEGWSTKPMVNVGRSRQEMSVWIRPVQPRHAVLAVKLALHELKKFIEKGLTQEELDRTRGFLLGYTRVLEESAGRRLGYALDDLFYKTPPHLKMAREAFQNMTLQEVNDAIKRSVSMDNLKIIVVTKDGKEFKEQLLSKDASPVAYDTPKPPEVLEEDRAVLAVDPGFSPEKITVIPVDSLFQ
jgi:zinc protease